MRVQCPADAVELGEILGAWGIHGAIKIRPYSASAEALFCAKTWFLRIPAQVNPLCVEQFVEVAVADVRAHNDALVATLAGIADRDAALELTRSVILVPRASFPPLGASEYYWIDLIGLAVVNRQGERLGMVTRLMSAGPQQVLVIEDRSTNQPGECLIPFVDAYVDGVDLTARCISVDWPRDY